MCPFKMPWLILVITLVVGSIFVAVICYVIRKTVYRTGSEDAPEPVPVATITDTSKMSRTLVKLSPKVDAAELNTKQVQ